MVTCAFFCRGWSLTPRKSFRRPSRSPKGPNTWSVPGRLKVNSHLLWFSLSETVFSFVGTKAKGAECLQLISVLSLPAVVNVSRSQQLFSSLISVDVEEDELISQVLQDRLLLAPTPRCQDAKATEGPSFLFFRTPDLFRQKPLPPDDGPVDWKLQPTPRPAHSTFDLYRRQKCWEATPWHPPPRVAFFWTDDWNVYVNWSLFT